ncbi:jg3191 [Pararge aegeria aegeria]|uniref:Jg3191 protein n=1 Tax=Pararge aegeria aegeria TaxID=348720 RepID=A0A8S4QHH0_9NEOP|nr:jg3191 [Pararge aegeria aegeria]
MMLICEFKAFYTVTSIINRLNKSGFSVVAPEVAVPGKTTAVLVTLHGSADNGTLEPLNVTVRLETQDADNDVKLLTTASQMITGIFHFY